MWSRLNSDVSGRPLLYSFIFFVTWYAATEVFLFFLFEDRRPCLVSFGSKALAPLVLLFIMSHFLFVGFCGKAFTFLALQEFVVCSLSCS